MSVQEATRKPPVKKKPQVAIMNAVHDLPVLAARDLGFFKDEGLDIDFITTPGMAQVTTKHFVKFDTVFDRPLDSVYNEGGIDQYRMCEWGIMKRAVEAEAQGIRRRKIVALGASMSMFAIAVRKDSKFYAPEMLKDQLIAVTPNNGSHFTTLKMMEGFLEPKHLKVTNVGTMPQRLQALKDGKVAAVSLMEPWISVAQKEGLRILIESHSTRAEAAGDELDGDTLRKMFRAQARAVEDLVSVGDSVGMNRWGRTDPEDMTLDEMVLVCKAVRRGTTRALVSCDLPTGLGAQGTQALLDGARRLVEEGGADMVKIDEA